MIEYIKKGLCHMKEMDLYNQWKSMNLEDQDLVHELAEIEGDQEAIKDRFYCELKFGTAGLRGVIGAGTNRMNIYVVRKTTQAMAEYLKHDYENPAVAISYDSRIKSDVFAKEAASVLAANGVKAYIYRQLMPVPCLSFAVRELNCQAGIMITASHNPAKYNGYKAYGPDGCQMTSESADKVLEYSAKIDAFHDVKLMDFDQAVAESKIEYISEAVEQKYLDAVKARSIHPEALEKANMSVVYTPLNGAGNMPVRKLLAQMGVQNVHVVAEQENPDGNFSTCPFPNPEIREALELGIRDCQTVKPDILLATDPDCDRMGIAVPDKEGNYVLLTGNEVGALLLEYICKERTALGIMPKNPIAVKTIVSTNLVCPICKEYGVELKNVLTGFKYIGEQIGLLEAKGEDDRFIFGFEESYGYLAGSYVRDKDAVIASMMICEMAAFYRQQGISVLDALNHLYEKYGVYRHATISFVCEGASGMERMAQIMSDIRKNRPTSIGGRKVIRYADYNASKSTDIATGEVTEIHLPKSDVLEYILEGGATVILRPSGTEPKIKAYYTATAPTLEEAEQIQKELQDDFTKILGF